jgi:hypothetical protein
MQDRGLETPGSWPRWRQRVAVIVWCSFLAACMETMGFFAYLDPAVVSCEQTAAAPAGLRPAAYGIGFFFFWASTVIAASLTAFLLDTGRRPSVG